MHIIKSCERELSAFFYKDFFFTIEILKNAVDSINNVLQSLNVINYVLKYEWFWVFSMRWKPLGYNGKVGVSSMFS